MPLRFLVIVLIIVVSSLGTSCSKADLYTYLDNKTASDFKRNMFGVTYAGSIKIGMTVDEVEAKHLTQMSVQSDPHPFDIRKFNRDDGVIIMLLSMEGMNSLFNDADIDGFQIYTEFLPDEEGVNRLIYIGERHKCARGKNTTEWTSKHCP